MAYIDSNSGTCGVRHAIFSLVMCAIGAGVFSIPVQFAKLGFLPATILLVLCGTLCAYGALNIHMAVHLSQTSEKTISSFSELGMKAGGFVGSVVSEVCMQGILLLVCAILLFVMGGQMHSLLPGISQTLWCIIVSGACIPLVCFPTLKDISALSTAGICSLFLTFVLYTYLCVSHLVENGVADIQLVSSDISFSTVATSFCNFTFSFGANAVVPALNSDCKAPKKTVRLGIAFSYTIMFILYVIVSVLGYLSQGHTCDENILDSVKPSKEANPTMFFAISIAVMVLAVSHFLVSLAPVGMSAERFANYLYTSVTGNVFLSKTTEWGLRICSRTLLLCIPTVLAAIVPPDRLGGLVSLAGGLFGMMLLLIVPCFLYWGMLLKFEKSQNLKKASLSSLLFTRKIETALSGVMIFTGSFGLCYGTYCGAMAVLSS